MKISLITTAWNSGETIRDTMESALKQTYSEFEHIIVDGASSDNTMEIVKEFEPRYNGRLKYISEPDHGIYDAMNKGLKMATGDVIGILNSDDFFSAPDILQTVAENIENVDAVYADVHYIKDNNVNHGVRYYSSRRFRKWKMRLGFMPAHPTFYCKKNIYDIYGYFKHDFKIASDFELLLRFIYLHNIKTNYIQRNFVTMRIGGASTSGLQSHIQILKDHMKAYKINGVYSNYLLEGLRYIYKLLEISYYRLRLPIDKRRNLKNTDTLKNITPTEYISTW